MTSYTFSLKGLPGGLELTGTVETEKELFRQVHFWQGLPVYCPIDGTATVLAFKEPDDFQYYSLQSTGWPVFEYKLGQHKTKGTLFPKGQWTHYDGNSEIVVWENGRYTPAGVKFRQADATGTMPATSQTTPTPAPLPGMCAECRAPEGKPHANSCSKFVKPKAEEVDFRGPAQTGASEEFAAIPSVPTGQTASAHTAAQAVKLDAAILRKFHAVGHTLYGDSWDDKRPELVKAATKGRAESSSDMTEAEANKLIAGMQKRVNAGESAQAQPSETVPF